MVRESIIESFLGDKAVLTWKSILLKKNTNAFSLEEIEIEKTFLNFFV